MEPRLKPDSDYAELHYQILVVSVALVVVIVTSSILLLIKCTRENVPSETYLNRKRQSGILVEKIALSQDTWLFRFGLPANNVLGLPTGQHVKIFCPNPAKGGEWNSKPDTEAESEEIERKYTPTSSDVDVGHFDLVVKVYKPNERFSSGGKASQYLNSLNVGDAVDLSGPWGMITYTGKGQFKKSRKDLPLCTHVAMIAGGTGITPMLQVIEAILRDEDDPTQISLVFANQTEGDILLRDELEQLAAKHPGRFKLHLAVDRSENADAWKGSVGYVTREVMKTHLPEFGPQTLALLCGPPMMVKLLKENLTALDCAAEQVLEF